MDEVDPNLQELVFHKAIEVFFYDIRKGFIDKKIPYIGYVEKAGIIIGHKLYKHIIQKKLFNDTINIFKYILTDDIRFINKNRIDISNIIYSIIEIFAIKSGKEGSKWIKILIEKTLKQM
jgi:hypothetical protein